MAVLARRKFDGGFLGNQVSFADGNRANSFVNTCRPGEILSGFQAREFDS